MRRMAPLAVIEPCDGFTDPCLGLLSRVTILQSVSGILKQYSNRQGELVL